MEKQIYNEQTGIRYELQGDYYLPCLKLPDEEQKPIGILGQRHAKYLKEHHKVMYYNLLTSCKLTAYLADIDEQAEEMFNLLVKQLSQKEGITEHLKSKNPMLWVQKMNNIRNRAEELVNGSLINA
ncbi:MAG: TnpV protein [Ruminococcus sp.]|nr:TnpV protein [Ruminococcus sp.]